MKIQEVPAGDLFLLNVCGFGSNGRSFRKILCEMTVDILTNSPITTSSGCILDSYGKLYESFQYLTLLPKMEYLGFVLDHLKYANLAARLEISKRLQHRGYWANGWTEVEWLGPMETVDLSQY